MPGAPSYGQPSVFFRLFQAGRSCRVYYRDTPLALLFDDQRVGDESAGYDPRPNDYPFVLFGGFADHVLPPPAIPPDVHQEEYTFDRLGVRVPAALVSPWLARQVVDAPCDYTSLLRSLTEK
ncbi:MAG TPA: alkaline phosphatase family protein [Methylomirabilota bacterium]|nr:alkaline phosphatase family protein [Methylomirabilota bacterium]